MRGRLQRCLQKLRGGDRQLIGSQLRPIETLGQFQQRRIPARANRLDNRPGPILDHRVKKTGMMDHRLKALGELLFGEPQDVHLAGRTLTGCWGAGTYFC